jgi:5-aminolevulinate synthase
VGRIEEILDLCRKSCNTISFIDEVHAVGLYGHEGGGICQQLGVEEQVDVITGTLGKAYGALGGYVALSTDMRHKLEDNMLEYQKECFLPAPMLSAALSSVQHLRTSQLERTLHQANAIAFREAAHLAQLPVMDSESHIMPLIVGDPVKCCEASQMLFEKHGIYVQPINYPTVPVGTERLRCTPGPMHTSEMIIDMVSSLREVYEELDIPLSKHANVDEVTHSHPLPTHMMEAPRVSSTSACICAPLHPLASGEDTVEEYQIKNECPFSVDASMWPNIANCVLTIWEMYSIHLVVI